MQIRRRHRKEWFGCSLRELLVSIRTCASGSITAYAVFAIVLLAGSTAFVSDYGRMVLLRNQMQNTADAAALSGGAQLDHFSGARKRAEKMARNAVQDRSQISAKTSSLAVKDVNFYYQISPTRVAATNDIDAYFIEVTLEPRDMNLVFAPILVFFGGQALRSKTLTAKAIAVNETISCNTPPFMICDPSEKAGSPGDIMDPKHAGEQYLLKEGGGGGYSTTYAPGNYGLLCLADGNCGADAIGDVLASLKSNQCIAPEVQTAPGSKTNQVRNGLNTRMDQGSKNPKNPAPNVINYPRDSNMDGVKSVGNDGLLGEISLLSPAYLLSVERWPFHLEPPDHYGRLSSLLDLSVSQSGGLMPLHSTADFRPA